MNSFLRIAFSKSWALGLWRSCLQLWELVGSFLSRTGSDGKHEWVHNVLVSTYCEIAPGHEFHGPYHEFEYGFPITDDDALFERLMLEINQAGLSWLTILKKREGYRVAYAGFRVAEVASFGDPEQARLLANPGIVRNRLKIKAAVENAKRVQELQHSHGSFLAWLDSHHPRPFEDWVKVFRKTFTFTGPEVVREFLLSTGYLPGAHLETCPVFEKILALSPPWTRD